MRRYTEFIAQNTSLGGIALRECFASTHQLHTEIGSRPSIRTRLHLERMWNTREVPSDHEERHQRAPHQRMRHNRLPHLGEPSEPTIVGRFGIISDYYPGAEYGRSQQLSAVLFEAGFSGIRSLARHDPALPTRLDAPLGERRINGSGFAGTPTKEILGSLVMEAQERYGLEVVGEIILPRASQHARCCPALRSGSRRQGDLHQITQREFTTAARYPFEPEKRREIT